MIKTFDEFSFFSGCKINNAKCEISSIGVKKGVKMALCGTEGIGLKDDLLKDFKYLLFLQEKTWIREIFLESNC